MGKGLASGSSDVNREPPALRADPALHQQDRTLRGDGRAANSGRREGERVRLQ